MAARHLIDQNAKRVRSRADRNNEAHPSRRSRSLAVWFAFVARLGDRGAGRGGCAEGARVFGTGWLGIGPVQAPELLHSVEATGHRGPWRAGGGWTAGRRAVGRRGRGGVGVLGVGGGPGVGRLAGADPDVHVEHPELHSAAAAQQQPADQLSDRTRATLRGHPRGAGGAAGVRAAGGQGRAATITIFQPVTPQRCGPGAGRTPWPNCGGWWCTRSRLLTRPRTSGRWWPG